MSEAYIPLLKDNKDIHYRYKMPKLTAKVEGSGNGIKTVITNMCAIAKALNRPATYPTKYFGCELGAQVTMTNNIYIVNGAHDAENLLNLLYAFIKKFVICTKCNNPETELKVVKNEIHQKCIACGASSIIPKTIHKLTTYIINHPPNETTSSKDEKSSKSSKSKEKKSKKNGSHSPNDSTDDKKEDIQHQEIFTAPSNGNNNNDDDDFDDEDLTPEATAERIRKLAEDAELLHLADPSERANVFYKLLIERKNANQLSEVNVQKELISEAIRLGVKDKATLILSEVLFNENIIEQIKTHRLLLLRFCHENPKAQKYLLGGFEKIVGDVYKDQLMGKVAIILKAFYDADILEEDSLLEWAEKPSKKYVSKDISKLIRDKAAPFIKWLKEAEVEEEAPAAKPTNGTATNGKAAAPAKSGKVVAPPANGYDDEDDEDDIDIEYSHRVEGIKVETVKQPQAVVQEDLADLNIDDI